MKTYFFRMIGIAAVAVSITTAWIKDTQPKQLHTTLIKTAPNCEANSKAITNKKTPLFHQYLYNVQD